jgi:hypothetical protein
MEQAEPRLRSLMSTPDNYGALAALRLAALLRTRDQVAAADSVMADAIRTGVLTEIDLAITAYGNELEGRTEVVTVMRHSRLFALGQPAGDLSVPGEGTKSDLLHFTIDDSHGVERVMLPIYSDPQLMVDSLIRNPDWQQLNVLEIAGDAILDNVDEDVIVVVNPWSRLEYQIPIADLRAS